MTGVPLFYELGIHLRYPKSNIVEVVEMVNINRNSLSGSSINGYPRYQLVPLSCGSPFGT
jgi:hypothetical protein